MTDDANNHNIDTKISSHIGVLMITKNAQKHLEAALASVVEWVDEIVIVDAGSTDQTLEIAKRFHAKVYHQSWLGFGPQRQFAQTQVNAKWVLALDSDEIVSPQLKESILAAVKSHQNENAPNICYQINRLSKAFGQYIYHSGWYPDKITRLYPNQLTQYNDALVHESVIVPQNCQVSLLAGDLYHETIDNIPNHMLKTQQYMKAWVDQREGKKRSSLVGAISHGAARFIKMYIMKRGFLDGKRGLLLAILSANTTFTRYADLWLREEMKKEKLN